MLCVAFKEYLKVRFFEVSLTVKSHNPLRANFFIDSKIGDDRKMRAPRNIGSDMILFNSINLNFKCLIYLACEMNIDSSFSRKLNFNHTYCGLIQHLYSSFQKYCFGSVVELFRIKVLFWIKVI